MTIEQKFAILFLALVAVLAVASFTGRMIKVGAVTDDQRAVVDNLIMRTKAWWVIVAIFTACFTLGMGATVILFALISFYTMREFVSLTPTRAGDALAIAAAFYVMLPLQYWLIWSDWYGVFTILIPVYAFLLLPSVAAMVGDTSDFLLRVARLQWALMLTVYCISHAPALLVLNIPSYDGNGFLLLFFLLAVVQFSDVMQYVFGKLFGPAQDRTAGEPVEDMGGVARRRDCRGRRRCGALVDHAILTRRCGSNGRRHRPCWVSRRLVPLRDQTLDGCERLGHDGAWAWRRARPDGLGMLCRAAVFSSDALCLHVKLI